MPLRYFEWALLLSACSHICASKILFENAHNPTVQLRMIHKSVFFHIEIVSPAICWFYSINIQIKPWWVVAHEQVGKINIIMIPLIGKNKWADSNHVHNFSKTCIGSVWEFSIFFWLTRYMARIIQKNIFSFVVYGPYRCRSESKSEKKYFLKLTK